MRASNYDKSQLTWDRQLEVEGVEAEARPKGKAKHKAIILVLKDLQHFFGPMEKIIAIKRYDEEIALQAAKDFMVWKIVAMKRDGPMKNTRSRGS